MVQLFDCDYLRLPKNHLIFSLPLLLILCLSFLSCSSYPDSATTNTLSFPDEEWEEIENPEEAGWSTQGLEIVSSALDTMDTATLMIIQNGKVIRSWGDLDTKYRCHSIRKSFLSALYGIQVEEETISMDATMASLNIDDHDPLSETEKQATIRMLLKARSGIYHPALYETAAMAAARPERHSHDPDTFWYYNNWDFNALGTIYEQETGENIHESFYNRIAEPIGMNDYVPEDGEHYSGEASRHDAYPFEMSTRDMARFGLLFLSNGDWNGQQIISENWVEESTTAWSDTGNNGGYGYLWWVSVDGQHFSGVDGVPEGTYTGRGYRGHVLAVVPEFDLVVVHRVDTFESGTRVPYADVGKVLMLIFDAYQNS